MNKLSEISQGTVSLILLMFATVLIANLLGILQPYVSSSQEVGQEITFINSTPGSIIGLVKFDIGEDGELIDYVVLDIQWTDGEKTVVLEPGLYGATKFDPVFDVILGYSQFWVKDKPITIYM